MTQQPLIIKVESEEELLKMAQEAVHILKNLRYWQSAWQTHYGGELLKAKKKWEQRADDFLSNFPQEKTNHADDLSIQIKKTEP